MSSAAGNRCMATQVNSILELFDMLSEADKRALAAEIIKRSLQLDAPPLTDEELIGAAAETFLDLDRHETRVGL
jgi:hypothetical protein